jgi:surface protein
MKYNLFFLLISYFMFSQTPTVTLTDTDSDNIVSNTDVVTITATFSESMAATPTLSLSGITSNVLMSATGSESVWTYSWTVSTTFTSTTATVSGSDLAGNAYAGTNSISFTVDNTAPKAGGYQIVTYEYFEYDELVKLESLNGGSGWNGAWIDYGALNDKQGHYILSQTSRGNTDSSQSDGVYALNLRSPMTYPGLDISGNYLGGINWQTDVPTKSYRELDRKLGQDVYVQFLVQFNDNADADNGVAKNNYFILQEGGTQRLVIRRKNGRIYMAKTTSSSTSEDLVDTGVSLKGSADAQLVIVKIGESKTKIWVDPNLSSFNYSNPPIENAYLDYIFEFDRINIESQNKYINGVPSLYDEISIFQRGGSLSDTDSDNIVSNSDVVTITATFSESMAATPTLSLSGITSDALMSATATASIWTYAWTVSTTVTSTTATVSGTDLAGNTYTGTDSITFAVDNTAPTVTLTDTDSDNIVSNTDVVTITATFSESMAATPTLSLSGITSNVLMSATGSESVWTYSWTVSTTFTSTTATVSGSDLAGNAYAGTNSISFTVDNTAPKAGGYQIVTYEYFEYDELVKLESLNGGSGWNGAWIDYGALNDKQGHYILSQTSRGNTDSSQSDGVYALNLRSPMTYLGLDISGNYLGGINWQTDVPTKSYRELDRKLGQDVYVQFLVQFNDNADADNGVAKNNYFILQEGGTQRLVIRRKNGRIYMAKTTSSSTSEDLVDTGVSLKGSADAQLVIVKIGESKTKIWVDPNLSSFNYSNPPIENAYLDYIFEFDRINIESQNKYINGVPSLYDEISIFQRGGSLSDTDSDNIVSNSDVVTITATFSESMAATPTLSLSGITSDALMSATATASIWTYAWTVSTTVTSTTATVSGTDLAGNTYTGTDSITFAVDNTAPTVTLTDTDSDNIVSNTDVVTITATFSESMAATPTLSLSGITSNVLMSATGSESVWIYNWNINNLQSSTTIKSIPFEAYFDFETGDTDTNSFSTPNNYDLKISYNSTTSISSRFFWNESSVDVAYIFDKSFDEVKLNDLSGYYFCQHVNDSNLSCSDTDSPPTNFIVAYKTSEGNYYLVEFISETNSESTFKYKMLNTTATVSGTDLAGNAYSGTESITFAVDTTAPTITLTDTDSDNIVSNSDVVTITATFSESMAATPTLSLSGITSNVLMSATASDSVWTYAWTVSTTVTSTTATVSGTDLAGNAYTGMDSITFAVDTTAPTVMLTDTDSDNIVSNSDVVTITATFSESMAATPTLSLSGITSNVLMSATSSDSVWTYSWTVSTTFTSTTATVSGTDLYGNVYASTDSITFSIDDSSFIYLDANGVTLKASSAAVVGNSYALNGKLYTIVDNTNIVSQIASGNYNLCTSRVTNFSDLFKGNNDSDPSTFNSDISFWDTSNGTTMKNLFNLAVNFDQDLSAWDTSNVTDMSYMFKKAYNYNNGTQNGIGNWDTSKVTTMNRMFERAYKFNQDIGGWDTSKVSNMDWMFHNATIFNQDISDWCVPKINLEPDNFLNPAPAFINSSYKPNWGSCPDKIVPTVILSDTASDNLLSNADLVTITATFSESMAATPTLSLSGITSNVLMSATATASIWTYAWTVSTTVTSTTATVSGTDLSGNAYLVTDSLVFQINPRTSGGISAKKSTIALAPITLIGNGINTAVITVQAKDSLGQNFLEGGYQVQIFSPQGDLTTTDNQNGTYSANYVPEVPTGESEQTTFGYRVAEATGTATVILTVHRDDDGDGVFNIVDECPGTQAGLEVDATGCALNQLDSDNDGVFDDIDECPDTPATEINNVRGTPTFGELIPTVVDEFGCGASQRDTDGDGIVDTEDNCIDTANPDQADKDADGIGDVCDTDNPLPEITTTEIKFVQLPQNGTTVGKIEATDPDGEVLIFAQAGDTFTGVLSVAADGSIRVSSGALLTFDSTYNGALLGFTVSDGENEVTGSVKIVIEDAPRPPEISIITLEVSEDAEVGTIVGFVEAKDPMGGQIVSINLEGDGFIELVDGVLKTTQELDYETTTAHPFTITAQASDRSDGPGLTGSKSESIRVADIPNQTYTGRFFISIFNVADEKLGAKVDHRRYFNPHNKNLGKWKVKKKIKGGEDADKFTIKTRAKAEQQKNGDPVEEETEDYLDFITPPDFENPGDANKDNVYEVEIEYINTADGSPEVPIAVTQTNIQVPEGSTRTIELQAQPVLATEDTDGDGVVDILDNSPLVANADQTDEDGDGVGDVTDDFDHDGVWNPFDTCPDTPLGELVDLDGCLIYYLPPSNFSISKTEKCAGENSIGLTVKDTSVTYDVAVSGVVNTTDRFTGSSWSLDQLSAGIYTVCVTVEGVDPLEFERCFEVTITEPDPLVVSSFFSKSDQTVSFDLSGGTTYQITHNGKTTQTSSRKHTVALDKGINNISISTGIECQGLFENTYLNSYEVKYAPNPFKDELQLFIGGKDNLVEIGVYSSNGQLIDYQTVSLSFGMRSYTLETANYKQGVYIIKVKGQTLDQSIQVIKE